MEPDPNRVAAAQAYISALAHHRADDVPFAPDCTRVENGLKTGFSGDHLRRSLNRGPQFKLIKSVQVREATVTGDASINGESEVVLGQATVGQTLTINAATDLTATTLQVAGNSLLTSGADLSVTTFDGQGNLVANAGGDLSVGNGTVGGSATLSSVGTTTIDTLSTQGTLDVTSGAALAVTATIAGPPSGRIRRIAAVRRVSSSLDLAL